MHPRYDSESKQNDIALVELKGDVSFSEPLKIRPACLWTNANINQPKVIATGFGYTQYSGDSSKDLMKVPLDVLPTSRCVDSFEDQEEIVINGNQICAGVLAGGKDTCQGGEVLNFKTNVRDFNFFSHRFRRSDPNRITGQQMCFVYRRNHLVRWCLWL